MSEEPRPVRWYRRLLWLYPAGLRRQHGAEMVEVVRHRWRRAHSGSPAARARFLLRTFLQGLVQGALAWGDRILRGPDRHRRGSPARRLAGPASRLPDRLAELRIAARSLRRAPGFTVAAVLTLTLGIGANTAIFSIVETVLLEPLPYPAAERLRVIRDQPWTPAEILLDLQRSGDSFEAVAGFYPRRFAVSGGGEPIRVEGAEVTAGLLDLLGAGIVQGRGFTAADAEPGAAPTALIAAGLWRRRYGGSAAAVGRGIRVNGRLHEIVGIVEAGFRQLTPRTGDAELWLPLQIDPIPPEGSFTSSSATSDWAIPVLRLRPGASPRRAQAELDLVVSRFRDRHPQTRDDPRWSLRLEDLHSALVRDVRPALVLLQVAVAALLVLACINVANLMLVRRSARARELAVRSALGASRGDLFRHLLAESLLVTMLGGVAAILLTVGGLDLLVALAPGDLPRLEAVSVDRSVLLATLAICLVTAILFALLPAATTGLRTHRRVLQGGGRTTAGSPRGHRLSQGLVVAQVALTVALLVGAGLLVRSFAALVSQEPGFRAGDVVTVSLRLPADPYGELSRLEGFYRRVRRSVEAIPAVESVGVANYLPIRRGAASRLYVLEGRTAPEPAGAQYGVVSPGYFRTLEIPLLRGRTFRETDSRGARPVAVVDRAMWERQWPDEDPIGKRLRLQGREEWLTVVGVVGDIRGDGLASEPQPGLYISYQQRPDEPAEIAVGRSAVLLVRSRVAAAELTEPLRRAVWDVDPHQPVPRAVSLQSVLSRGVAPERFRALLTAGFAVAALLLVVAGIYGVVAYLVAERTHEFGVRVAVGATGADVVALVIRWGLRLTAVGVVVGLLAVGLASRHLGGLLFGVGPGDPLTISGSVALVVLVTVGACLVPARRALGLDPADTLRRGG